MKIKLFIIVCLSLATAVFAQAADSTGKPLGTVEMAIIQSSISPNGDGVNDLFVIQNIDQFPSNELYVFDKDGLLVYHTEYYFNTWDGKKDGQALPEEMYYYVFDDGRGTVHTGYLQLTK
jgi:gliding motility-associated-like protein